MSSIGFPTPKPGETGETPPCYDVDMESVKKICKDSNQVMVYGPRYCKYDDVASAMRGHKDTLQKVFTWEIASGEDSFAISDEPITAEGRKLNVIPYLDSRDEVLQFSRPCKTAIVDLVLENYKRIAEGKLVIPLLYLLEMEGDNSRMTMEDIAKKRFCLADKISFKELRRAYKLITHKDPKIRQAAEATFRFARLKYKGNETYALEQIPAPWADAKKAAELMEGRKKDSQPMPKDDKVNWKVQLEARVKEYESQRALLEPPILFPGIPALATKCIVTSLQMAFIEALKTKLKGAI